MSELRVPFSTDDTRRSGPAFRIAYRSMIVGSMLRYAQGQLDQARDENRRLRTRLAERRVEHLTAVRDSLALNGMLPIDGFSHGLKVVVSIAWPACGLIMGADLLAFGLHSWTTTVSMLATQVLTIVWFFVSLDSLGRARKPGPVDVGSPAETSTDATPEPAPQSLRLAGGAVCLRADAAPSLTLRAVTDDGGPVDLTRTDAVALADALQRLSLPLDQ